MNRIDSNHRPATVPGTGTPGVDYVMTEDDRSAMNEITHAVEFLMVAARAISRGFPKEHPEVTEYLTYAAAKVSGLGGMQAS